jgi:Peptidase U49
VNSHTPIADVYSTKFPLCDEAKDVAAIGLSPQLAHLFEAFRSSPFAAAPERASELQEIIERAGMCMRPDARGESWRFEAIPTLGKRIFVGTRTLERLWAYSYGFTAIITELQLQAQKGAESVPNPDEYLLAFYAVKWADQEDREDIEEPWPSALPDPRMTAQLEHVHAANEVFLMTAGRILLHEIAHVVFADAGTSSIDPKDEEFRADEWSDNWMLDQWKRYGTDERIFIKRCLGIAFAHTPAIRLGIQPERPSETHPSPIRRVVQFFDRIGTGLPSAKNPKDFPAAFLWMILLKTLVDKKILAAQPEVPSSYQEGFNLHAAHYEAK